MIGMLRVSLPTVLDDGRSARGACCQGPRADHQSHISALAAKRPRAFFRTSKAWPRNTGQLSRTFCNGCARWRGPRIQNTRHGRLWHPTASRARLHRGLAPRCQGSWNWPQGGVNKSLPAALGWRSNAGRRKAREREQQFLARTAATTAQSPDGHPPEGCGPQCQGWGPAGVDILTGATHGLSPCVTRARASTGHYLPPRGTAAPPGIACGHPRCEGNVSDRQLGAMLATR